MATLSNTHTTLLSIKDLHKHFSVPVLTGVNFDLRCGEVHALMGANGAGKTTLSNMICGFFPPTKGDMQFKGQKHNPNSVNQAEAVGIRMVMQELNLIDNLSIAENIFFKHMPHSRGFVKFEKMYEQAREALTLIGLDNIDPRQPMSSLGVGQQQLVEIAATLTQQCDLLILDEPTAALTDPQIDHLFEQIDHLKSKGVGMIYISHRMDEILRIADRVTVLRDGKSVATRDTKDITVDEIVTLMAGEDALQPAAFQTRERGSIAMQLKGISRVPVLQDISLDIYRGEILGIAGLIGSGRTELLRAIFGADPIDSGTVLLNSDQSNQATPKDEVPMRQKGTLSPAQITSPSDAVSKGIGLIPEDRKQQGLLLTQSITHNTSIASMSQLTGKLGWINNNKESETAANYRQSLAVRCSDIEQKINELSGGNQQKVIIARWLLKDCNVLLFDEPTRGIDIHTKKMIYQLLDELAGQGKAIVVVSSETSELTTVCDRIAVMSNGKLAATFNRGEWNAENIMAAAFSGYVGDENHSESATESIADSRL